MIRFFRLIFLLVLIVGTVVVGYLWITRVSTLERFLSQKANAIVTVDKITIGLNHLTIKGLKLQNLPPSALPYAFEGREITVKLNFLELLKKTIHIDLIKVQDPVVCVELHNFLGNDHNWARLLSLNESSRDEGRNFIIDKLSLTNIQFQAIRTTGKKISIPPIPYLELEKIGVHQPLTLSQVGHILFRTILATLNTQTSCAALLDNIATLPDSLLEEASSSHPFEQTKKIVQEGIDRFQQKATDASKFLQKLFTK